MDAHYEEDTDRDLRDACYRCNLSEVRRAVRLGASIAATLSFGWTSLHRVAMSHTLKNAVASVEVAQLLLDIDASLVNAQDIDGETPLRYSCHVPLSTILLERGANPNLQNNDGWTATHYACYHGPLELALLLIRFGGDVYLKDNKEKTPMDWCENGAVKLSRNTVAKAFSFAPAQNWLRRASFAVFLSALYGSAEFQSKQRRLSEEDRQAVVVVRSTDMRAWREADKVFGNPDLCREIAKYL